MALVSKNIPNLINGVSQQPPALRLGTQGEAQENGLSDVVDGLKKRPPTEFLKTLVRCGSSWLANTSSSSQGNLTTANTQPLTTAELNSAYISTYKRSSDEQYTVVIIPDATTPIVLAYDILGNLRYESKKSSWLADGTTITYVKSSVTYYGNSDDTSYLVGVSSTALQSTDITSTSVADATFVLNKKKVVGMSSAKIPDVSGYSALVYLKTVNYGRNYNITINTKTKDSSLAPITGAAVTLNSNQNSSGNYSDSGVVYNDNLKVSSVLTTLRGSLISSAGANVFTSNGQQSQGSTSTSFDTSESYPLRITEAGVYFESYVAALMEVTLTTSVYSSIPSTLLVTVGGSIVNYDANGVQGWKYHANHATNKKIQLPPAVATYVVAQSYGIGEDDYATVSLPYVSIKQTTASAGTGTDSVSLTVEPFVYTDEPYFVIQSPENGTLKDFTILATDDDGGANLRVFKENAKSFTDLPNQCIDGFRLGVVGDNQKKEDNFHVVFTGEAGAGYWKESVKAGILNYFDLTTMPHLLRQDPEQSGSLRFEFAEGSWDERKAGDDDTNSRPSFVGQTLSDVFFHRNRLGVLAGENVVFSEASGYFNFWRTTVRALLDSDPIDVAVSQNEVSVLKAAVPIQDNLLLFSELNQFTLSAAQLLTPTEVTIDQSTKFECDLEATPVGAGTSVFFATKAGGFAGVREYYTNNETEIKDASLITSHVPEYLQGNIRKMTASTNEDMLLCLTSKVKSEVYVYNFYDQGNERLQSAWSKWKFAKDIVDVSFNNADLYFTFSDGSFEKMDLGGSSEEITYSEANSKAAVLTLETKTVAYGGVDYNVKGYAIGDGVPSVSFGASANSAIKDVYLYQLVSDTSQRGLFIRLAWPYLAGSDVAPSTAQLPTSITVGGVTIPLTGSWYLGSTSYHQASITVPITDQNFTDWFGAAVDTTVVFNIPETAIDTTSRTYTTLLDHQVKVTQLQGDSTFNVADLDAQFTADSESQFVDHRGAIIARGDSSTEKAKVVAYIHNKQHKENGTLVNNYVYAGRAYIFKYQLSEQVFKPVDGDVTQLARFQLRRLGINYSNTGTFDVTVKSTGREANVTKFTGRILGQADNILGYSPVVEDGSINIGIQSQAKETDITITNSSHLPCVFQSAEWEGFVVLRNQRL